MKVVGEVTGVRANTGWQNDKVTVDATINSHSLFGGSVIALVLKESHGRHYHLGDTLEITVKLKRRPRKKGKRCSS